MSIALEAVRDCLEGVIPGVLATGAPDGTPNVSYVSQVHYVDPQHVALSFQFFNKTRENVLANPRAAAMLTHPLTGARYVIDLEYLRTELEGPLFESMKAKLAGIASHTGMAGVFKLRGADLYRVLAIEQMPGRTLPLPAPRRNLLSAVRAGCERIGRAADLGALVDETLDVLASLFDIRHCMILVLDGSGQRLFTVASRGYPQSGIGSEIALGCGVIGVAAEQRTAIRINHASAEYSYGRAIRESAEREGMAGRLETAIPFPGLADSRSQLAVPIAGGRRLLGVLYVESAQDMRFNYDDEDALAAIATHLALASQALQQAAETAEEAPPTGSVGAPVRGAPVEVRRYAADDSIFIGEDYLIKGVAGAIFWKLVGDHARTQRSEFSNRELRLDPSIRLPDLTDNLEARLILLERRLAERGAFARIEKTGRGRFRLVVSRPFRMVEVPGDR